MKQLPEAYEKRMKALLGEEYENYLSALESPSVRALRVNTEKITPEEFEALADFPIEKMPYTDSGYYFTHDKIGNHPCHHAGLIYVQEPGAMAPGECVAVEKHWKILDMCAAPGGKSSQLKNKLGEKGVLVSNEIIPSRCKILTGNVERLGLTNTVVTCMDTAKLASLYPHCFDLIMADAPCSGEGMFRKDDTAIEQWSEENVYKCAQRQKEILRNAALCLKDGGYIIYATCTFSPEENEMVVDSFLQEHPDFEIVRVPREIEENTVSGISFEGCQCENIHFARRFYPHKSKGEGQFMAVLHNKADTLPSSAGYSYKSDKVDPLVFDFLDNVLTDYDKSRVVMYNGNPVYFTPDFPVTKGAAFACGVTIGEIKKNYIQPHHQLFMAMGHLFRRKINLSQNSPDLMKYLHGEEIDAPCENGWAAVTFEGYTIGGAKAVAGRGKNHYPKGLRLKG